MGVAGTSFYIAPEVYASDTSIIGHKPQSYDARCDVWSVGVVLHLLISGKLPFINRGAQKVSTAILNCSEKLALDSTEWLGVSTGAKNFIR